MADLDLKEKIKNFWEYIYEKVGLIDFSEFKKEDLKKLKEGFLFSNETTVIMSKIMEKFLTLNLKVNLLICPDFIVHDFNKSAVVIERYTIILGYPNLRNHIDILLENLDEKKLPKGWFVIKYEQPNKYALDDLSEEFKTKINEIRETKTKIRIFLNDRISIDDELKLKTKVKDFFGEEITNLKAIELFIEVGASTFFIKKISKFCDVCNYNMELSYSQEIDKNICPICLKYVQNL